MVGDRVKLEGKVGTIRHINESRIAIELDHGTRVVVLPDGRQFEGKDL
jgi:preprotein translocase subunit YajC